MVAPLLISAFVLATYMYIVQSLFFLNKKFQASSHHLWFVSELVGNPDKFSNDEAHLSHYIIILSYFSEDRFYSWGRTGAVVSLADYGPRGPWFDTWPGRRGLEQVTFTPLLKPRKLWTYN